MKEDVLMEKPGRELNIRVAQEIVGRSVVTDKIFGDLERHTDEHGASLYRPLQPYSEDIAAAQTVVEKMRALGFSEAEFWKNDLRPDVICKAALSAMQKRKQELDKKQGRARFRVVK